MKSRKSFLIEFLNFIILYITDVTLYSDSFNTDSHSSCSNEEGSDIKNANLRTVKTEYCCFINYHDYFF